ncbi:hypothetical protein, partial [Pseudomonas aeruginosa]|uniref:hypothetical protein n=1 Tax=Pseudomonas aeruginosa TaxID=287 RepID=UPI001C9D8832
GVQPTSAFLPRFSSGPPSRGSQRVDVAFFPSSALEAFHSSTAPYRVRPGWRAGVFVQLEVVVFGSLIFFVVIFCSCFLISFPNIFNSLAELSSFLLHELVGGTSSLLCFADREGSRIRVFRLFRL